ncbi:MAG: hypothetical protein ACYDCC_03840 [Actinomycetota bacterium]
MIWVTWRQHRGQLIGGAILLGVIATLLLITGVQISNTFHSSGLAHCLARTPDQCGQLQESFRNQYRFINFLPPLFLIVPLLLGMFWGAPLIARELEQGTHRLAWTQAVTRRRWIASKLALISTFTVIFAIGWAWLVTWWSSPFVATGNRFDPGLFDLRGIVPVAYTLFALALGVAAGAVLGKTMPALVTTLVSFSVVRLVVLLFVRSRYMAAKTISFALGSAGGDLFKLAPPPDPSGWVISQKTLDSAGRLLWTDGGIRFDPGIAARCGISINESGPPDPGALNQCLSRLGAHMVSTYQPDSRYWTFQGIEFVIFTVLAVGLMIFAVRRLRHTA